MQFSRYTTTALIAVTITILCPLASRAQEAPLPSSGGNSGNPTAPASNSSGTTLDLTLNTGDKPAPSPTAEKPKATSAPVASRKSGGRLPSLPLPSRGGVDRSNWRQQAQKAPAVLAQLGLVITDKVQLRISRESNSRLLSEVPKGTHLAIVSEMGEHWGVLMINNTVGWVSKASIELLDYQTEVNMPTDPNSGQPTAAEAAGGYLSGLPENLDGRRLSLLKEAFTYLGVPYVWAGNTRSGLDCSAFVKNVFNTQGIRLPRVSADQAKVGTPVQGTELQAGDRLYFDMKHVGRITHTGIYLGNGLFIHASTNQGKVGIDSIFKPNYYRALAAARRD